MAINNPIISIAYLATAMAFPVAQSAMAATVYQWTDAEGVVHFSDVVPKGDIPGEVREIEFVDYAVNDIDADQYSITSQLQQMTEWRRQIEEERNARKQLQLEARRLEQERHAALLAAHETEPYHIPLFGHHNLGHRFGHGFGHGFGRGHHFSGKHFGGVGRFGGGTGKGNFGKSAGGGTVKSRIDLF